MPIDEESHKDDALQLPASSWWIPSLTAVVIMLAVVTALA